MAQAAYEVGQVGERCAVTGRSLEPGAAFIAVLVEPEPGAPLLRHDVAQEAWDAGSRPERVFAYWRGVVGQRASSSRPVIDGPALIELFEQLEERPEPKAAALRYVLGLVLIRKRMLVVAGSAGDGALLVRPSGAPEAEPWTLADPGLDEAASSAIADELRTLLRIQA